MRAILEMLQVLLDELFSSIKQYVVQHTCGKVEAICFTLSLLYYFAALIFVICMQNDIGVFDGSKPMADAIVSYGDGWSIFFVCFGVFFVVWLAFMIAYLLWLSLLTSETRSRESDQQNLAAAVTFMLNVSMIFLILALIWHQLIYAFVVAIFGGAAVVAKTLSVR